MDFESPDVEKDFPGLYASESGRKSNESDFSDGADHDKPSKKHLLGHRKDKKEKKDRGYAALEGESSPEEDTDAKSPSKSKKTKAFKFPTKSKEKREKSREKEKVLEEAVKQKEFSEKEKKKERDKEKEKEKEKKEKKKEKDKEKEEKAKFKLESKEKLKDDKKDKIRDKEKEKSKEKDKDKGKEKEKVKEKDKDKKEKKLTKMPSIVTSGVPFEEIFTLGVALPIFGVPLQQSVERLRCHDDSSLPLVVRDSIDYLQAHGLKSPQIYRGEADKIKLSQLRTLYMDRGATFPYHWDVAVACAMLKSFLSELPESILTIELEVQFSQAIAIAPPQREITMAALIHKLPTCNHNLLGWLIRHFESVLLNTQANQSTIQSISAYMGAALNMSQNLLAYLITNAEKLFPDVRLTKYVPPLLALPADFSECPQDIASELRKQESLLNQIHLEMHAGFITPARDQRLWEAQRIVTQLKRQLRAVQKSVEPNTAPVQQTSIEEKQSEEDKKTTTQIPTQNTQIPTQNTQIPTQSTQIPTQSTQIPTQTIEEIKTKEKTPDPVTKPKDAFKIEGAKTPIQEHEFTAEFEDNFEFRTPKKQTPTEKLATPEPVKDKPKFTEEELQKLRLELENAEYQQLKSLLQAKINSEQFEIVKLRSQVALRNKQEGNVTKEVVDLSPEEEQRLAKEIAVMEHKRMNLIEQIFQERVACLQLKIDLAMKELH